jgi:hypothetical protein
MLDKIHSQHNEIVKALRERQPERDAHPFRAY